MSPQRRLLYYLFLVSFVGFISTTYICLFCIDDYIPIAVHPLYLDQLMNQDTSEKEVIGFLHLYFFVVFCSFAIGLLYLTLKIVEGDDEQAQESWSKVKANRLFRFWQDINFYLNLFHIYLLSKTYYRMLWLGVSEDTILGNKFIKMCSLQAIKEKKRICLAIYDDYCTQFYYISRFPKFVSSHVDLPDFDAYLSMRRNMLSENILYPGRLASKDLRGVGEDTLEFMVQFVANTDVRRFVGVIAKYKKEIKNIDLWDPVAVQKVTEYVNFYKPPNLYDPSRKLYLSRIFHPEYVLQSPFVDPLSDGSFNIYIWLVQELICPYFIFTIFFCTAAFLSHYIIRAY